MTRLLLTLAALEAVTAFPWVANVPGVDSSLLERRHRPVKRQAPRTCPFNSEPRPGAAEYTEEFPYTGAKNGLPGSQIGGIKVPADGDTAHQYTPPGELDIRGPCPGLNSAANHNFLSHDGITTFAELVDAQQNMYNVGYDLAVLLATLGVSLDGDIISTKLSINCDATERTSTTGGLLGRELGLAGHNRFEADTSLTRNDYFLADGDNFSFNGTLFGMMQNTCQGNFNRENIAKYRSQRYDESVSTNPNFYFGPKSLLLFGASSFLYELFPIGGNEGTPDLNAIGSFFGAVSDGKGGWDHVPERAPKGFVNRKTPYTILDVAGEIRDQYLMYPKLFGGNVGTNNFDLLGEFAMIKDGKLPNATTAADLTCLLYQIATDNVPSSLDGVISWTAQQLSFITSKLNPVFKNSGCPLKVTG